MLKFKKIVRINFILFFVGWIIIFLLGADFPPPIGFIWLVLLIFILDILQTYYLKKYFLRRIEKDKKTKLFFMNTLFYFFGSVTLSLLTYLYNFQMTGAADAWVWIIVITIVGILYGIAFWGFNVLLFHLIK